MIPDWLPVKLIASPPSSRIARERRAIEIRSPADSSMSSSRRCGFGDTFFAIASSSSVVSPIAETTTTDVVSLRARPHDALRHTPELVDVGDAAAAASLDDDRHRLSIADGLPRASGACRAVTWMVEGGKRMTLRAFGLAVLLTLIASTPNLAQQAAAPRQPDVDLRAHAARCRRRHAQAREGRSQ